MKTVCGYCGVGCGMEMDTKLKGIKDYPSNLGLLCKKGALSDKIVDNRIKKPLFRKDINSEFREISWDEAIKLITDKIKSIPSQKTALYLSGQLLNEDYYVANKLGKGFIKTPHVDTNSRTCMSSAVVAYKKILGSDYVPITMDDAINSDLLVLAGSNAAETHIVFFNRIKSAKKRGLKVIVIDPRFTKTAKIADLYIRIKPGCDTLFFNASAKMMFDEGFVDEDFLRVNTNHYEEYLRDIKSVDIEKNLKICGVSKKDLKKFIDLWQENENVTTAWTMGLNQSSEGVEKNISFINLSIISGKIFKPLNGPLSLTGQPNAMGGREVGGLSTMLAVHMDYTQENVKKAENFWKTKNIANKPGLTAYEMITKGNLKCLIISHTDPIYHLPNRKRVEECFKKIEFVVEINAYKGSQTSKFAHLILPALAWGEKIGTQTNLDRLITLQRPIREPFGEAKADWEIFSLIGKALGYKKEFDFISSYEVFEEYKEMTKLSSDLNICETSYEKLSKRPFRWGENLKEALTANKKLNLYFPKYHDRSLKTNEDYHFVLLTVRSANHWHSKTKTFQISKDKTDFIEINPDDAKKLSVKEGEYVKVSSKFGKLSFKVKISDIRQGSIAVSMHCLEVNYLTSDILDPISKEPDYNCTPVKITA